MVDKKTQSSNSSSIVLSASRRTDLICCYPDYLVEKLAEYPPEKVHSIVIWTKNPLNMLTAAQLHDTLIRYRQLYIHLTITGLGATVLEPRIPAWREVVDMIPGLLEMAGDPHRISWRFDPLVRCEGAAALLSNYELFSEIAGHVAAHGITVCRTSWVESYRKVLRRMDKKGFRLLPHSMDERREQAARLQRYSEALGITMQFCSMKGFPRSRCIDGPLLSRLHPDGLQCSSRKAKGQRTLCGCTESLDIGWYSMKCYNGCVYCYAEPLVE